MNVGVVIDQPNRGRRSFDHSIYIMPKIRIVYWLGNKTLSLLIT